MTDFTVFVYGTLMRGQRNSEFMKYAVFIGAVLTQDFCFQMIEYPSKSAPGHFTPAVIKGGQGQVKGELYKIDGNLLKRLDDFEENGFEYQREEVLVTGKRRAWMYHLIGDKAIDYNSPRVIFDENTKIYYWRGV